MDYFSVLCRLDSCSVLEGRFLVEAARKTAVSGENVAALTTVVR